MKTLYALFLASSLLIVTPLMAQNASCIATGKTLLGTDQACCPNLNLNPKTKNCEDASPVDTTFQTCSTDGDCSNNQGCFPQRFEDMFAAGGAGADQLDTLVTTPKDNGAACTTNTDCHSYNCAVIPLNGKSVAQCQQKTVCRYGAKGEVAQGAVKCQPELAKTTQGICDFSIDAKNNIYLGITNSVSIKPVEGQQCAFQMSDETRARGLAAMKAVRGLEWLLAAEPTTGDDCMKITVFLRNNLRSFIKERQVVVDYFNSRYKEIENDSQTLLNANKTSTASVTIDGEQISQKDLESRKASGYDMLKFMWRRNLLFQSYETSMKQLVQKYNAQLTTLAAGMDSWTDYTSKEWDLGGVHYVGSNETCRGGGFLGLGRRKIYKRWANHLSLTKDSAVPNNGVMTYLQAITQESSDDISKKLFGHKTGVSTLANILTAGMAGLLNSIFGGSPPSYIDSLKVMQADSTATRAQYKSDLKAFYQGLITDSSNPNYIFEPEILPIASQSCLNNPNSDTDPKCQDFRNYMDDMADNAYAQAVAYSYHTRNDYKNFFNSGLTWRRKLLAFYQSQLVYLGQEAGTASGGTNGYYATVSKNRDEQNACIERVLNHVAQNYLDNSSSGLNEGKNYYQGGVVATTSNVGPASSIRQLSAVDRSKYQFDLNTLSNSTLNSGKTGGTVASANNSGSGSVGTAGLANAMALRAAQMQASNAKAAAAGVNISAKDAIADKAISAIGSFGSSGSAGSSSLDGSSSSSSAGRSNSLLNTNAASAMANKDLKDSSTNAASAAKAKTAMTPITTAGAAAGAAGSGVGGINSADPYGKSGSGSDSSSTHYNDPTGMSDEEKEVMSANYERNKSEYKSNEDDTLFKVITKSYVRNLDKVLTKKKRIEE